MAWPGYPQNSLILVAVVLGVLAGKRDSGLRVIAAVVVGEGIPTAVYQLFNPVLLGLGRLVVEAPVARDDGLFGLG